MHRFVRSVSFAVVCACIAAAPSSPAELLLKSKGLHLVSHYYLLDDDINLAESVRAMKAAQHKVDDYTHHQAAIESDIDSANSKLHALQTQDAAMTDELDQMGKSAWASYNKLVRQINAGRDQIRAGNKYVTQRQKDLAALDDPSDQYNAEVNKCNVSMDALAHRYEVLAADPEVTAALATLNKTASPKVQLGPSVQFKEQRPIVQKLAKSQSEASVPFVTAGGVPQVPVTLNGTLKLDMIVDSGAAEVTLSMDTARQLGLKPGPKDRVMKLQSADGKITEAHVKTLKSIRLGPFTAENVECAIQPPNIKGADNLLGDTFLKRFIYRMDLSAGVLHLSERPQTADPVAPPEVTIKLEFVSARWGSGDNWDDVTAQVKQLIAASRTFTLGRDLFSHDPRPGVKKQLQVTIMQDGVKKLLKFREGKTVNPSDLQT